MLPVVKDSMSWLSGFFTNCQKHRSWIYKCADMFISVSLMVVGNWELAKKISKLKLKLLSSKLVLLYYRETKCKFCHDLVLSKFVLTAWEWKWQRSLLLFEVETMIKWLIWIWIYDLIIEKYNQEILKEEDVVQLS